MAVSDRAGNEFQSPIATAEPKSGIELRIPLDAAAMANDERPVRVNDALGGVTLRTDKAGHEYDLASGLVGTTDAEGARTSFELDGRGLVTGVNRSGFDGGSHRTEG